MIQLEINTPIEVLIDCEFEDSSLSHDLMDFIKENSYIFTITSRVINCYTWVISCDDFMDAAKIENFMNLNLKLYLIYRQSSSPFKASNVW